MCVGVHQANMAHDRHRRNDAKRVFESERLKEKQITDRESRR